MTNLIDSDCLDGVEVECDAVRVICVSMFDACFDGNGGGTQIWVIGRAEGREDKTGHQVIKGELGVSVKLATKFGHLRKPGLNVGVLRRNGASNSAGDAAGELQMSHEHAIKRVQKENCLPALRRAIRFAGGDVDENLTNFGEV